MTEAAWANLVLTDIGAPHTQNNVQDMMRWMTREEPTSNWADRNNPLNASLGTNSADGLGSYGSLTVGAQQTAAMIKQGNMAGIDRALVDNASPLAFSEAVVASPWASSHYGWAPNAISSINPPSGSGIGGLSLGKGTGPAPNSHSQSQNSGILGWLGSVPGDIGSGLGTVLSIPETAAVDAVGFGVGLVWPLILRLVITFVLIALALIVAWHLIGKTGVGKAAEGAALRAAKAAAMA